MNTASCPSCFARGYKPEYRKDRPGFYARMCPRCGGSGSIPESKLRKSEHDIPLNTVEQSK